MSNGQTPIVNLRQKRMRLWRTKSKIVNRPVHDFIIIGSGIGGLTAAALLAKRGFKVLTLEASYVPGGCASSYLVKRDGQKFIFESGATTIVGLDEHQPLKNLERELGITFPVVELSPSMTIHTGGKTVTRYKEPSRWVQECYEKFFADTDVPFQKVDAFWQQVFRLSDFVWRVSERNRAFPPTRWQDYLELLKKNPITDFPNLRFLFRSTLSVIQQYGLDKSPAFVAFCNEQLMITAQATTEKVAMLYAAPCLSYTSSANFYAYGGMIKIAETLVQSLQQNGGEIQYREPVTSIERISNTFRLTTETGKTFDAANVVSNATIWNMMSMTSGAMQQHFEKLSQKFSFGWGALTMSLAVKDTLDKNLTLHHQFILDKKIPHCDSDSFFVSLSMPDDTERQPDGVRLLAVSTHTGVERWVNENPNYDTEKKEVEAFILNQLEVRLPGFKKENIIFKTVSTPKSWQDWTWRKFGRVGGIPNTMDKTILDLVGAETGFEGLYLVGDTVYPGQGIAGVCLSGQNAVHRILQRVPLPNRNPSLPLRETTTQANAAT
jgi:C-3',4' desaturase CrtD